MQTLLRNKISFLLCVVFTYAYCIAVVAGEFSISNNQLIVSGEDIQDDEKILSLLESNEKIDTIVFQDVWSGTHNDGITISDIIIDFELDTHISGYCWGNCLLMFVAGENRTMERGSEIAIKFQSYSTEQIKNILIEKTYEYIFDSLEEYIVWIDDTSRNEIVEYFSLLVERGVKPEFIIKSVEKGTVDRWIPRRKELLKANVLTE